MNLKNRFKSKSVATIAVGLFALFSFSVAQADVATDTVKVRAQLTKMFAAAEEADIVASQVNNVYRVDFGTAYAFAFVDGDYVLIGDLFNVEDKVNLGEQAGNKKIAKKIANFPESKMIVYGPEKPEHVITVFTDIDCGYCRKLHNEVPALNAAGVQVRYLAFPRAGVGSASHNKYVSVWCNDDQQASLTDAKSGKSVATASCDNPIAESYHFGQQEIGVRGTPMIIFEDGTIQPGYLPSAAIIERLGA